MSDHPTLDLLLDYRDGALDATAHRAINVHLATCATCRAELALQDALDAALRAAPPEEPSPAFTDRVMEAITPAVTPRVTRPRPHALPARVLLAIGYATCTAAVATLMPHGIGSDVGAATGGLGAGIRTVVARTPDALHQLLASLSAGITPSVVSAAVAIALLALADNARARLAQRG